MQTPVPHVDPQSDPHDDIVAILRSDSAPRTLHDPSELHVGLADRIAIAKSIPMPELGPPASALNDDRTLPPHARRKRGGGFMRFVLTVCFGIAATVAYQAYGDTAREKLMAMAPELLGASPVLAENANATDPQTTAEAQPAAEAAPAQPAQAASAADTTTAPATTAAAPQEAVPSQAASPDLAPLIEGMSREIASLRESIEQLKTSQRQMSRDLAKAAEEPKETRQRKQTTATPPPPARPVADRLPPPQPRQQTISPPQQQVYIPPPPPRQSLDEPVYTPRPPRPLP